MILNNNQKLEQLDAEYPFVAGGFVRQAGRTFTPPLWYGCKFYPAGPYDKGLKLTRIFKTGAASITVTLTDLSGAVIGIGSTDSGLDTIRFYDDSDKGIGILKGDPVRLAAAIDGMRNDPPDSDSPGLTIMPSCCANRTGYFSAGDLAKTFASTEGVTVTTDGTNTTIDVYGQKRAEDAAYLSSINGVSGDIVITASGDSDVRVKTSSEGISFITKAEASNGA